MAGAAYLRNDELPGDVAIGYLFADGLWFACNKRALGGAIVSAPGRRRPRPKCPVQGGSTLERTTDRPCAVAPVAHHRACPAISRIVGAAERHAGVIALERDGAVGRQPEPEAALQ